MGKIRKEMEVTRVVLLLFAGVALCAAIEEVVPLGGLEDAPCDTAKFEAAVDVMCKVHGKATCSILKQHGANKCRHNEAKANAQHLSAALSRATKIKASAKAGGYPELGESLGSVDAVTGMDCAGAGAEIGNICKEVAAPVAVAPAPAAPVPAPAAPVPAPAAPVPAPAA